MDNAVGGFLSILLLVGILLIFPWAVKYLWNGLMPSIFGLRMIGFKEALGLLILCRILVGSTSK